ncbi:MAG: A24 family peptidase [Sandaracinaceae bacterium]
MIVADLPPLFLRALGFVFGALWGSFFNVAIHRWPRDMSVVSPPSHCPHCQSPIPWWRNVPIAGYLVLKGRAACCGHKLTPRYLFVELTSALLALALVERYVLEQPASMALDEALLSALFYFFFVGGLIIATFVDFEWFEIPDEVSIGGTAVGLASVALRTPGPDAIDCAVGAGVGFLAVHVLLVWSWERLTGRRGMGEGDPKLVMFIGAFLGWKGALFALVGGAFQGTIFALVAYALRRGREPERETKSDDAEEAEPIDPDRWVPPSPLVMADGTRVKLTDAARDLEVTDKKGRVLWDHRAADPGEEAEESRWRRPIPFGPFLALGALEFLFFGDRLVELYLGLFD